MCRTRSGGGSPRTQVITARETNQTVPGVLLNAYGAPKTDNGVPAGGAPVHPQNPTQDCPCEHASLLLHSWLLACASAAHWSGALGRTEGTINSFPIALRPDRRPTNPHPAPVVNMKAPLRTCGGSESGESEWKKPEARMWLPAVEWWRGAQSGVPLLHKGFWRAARFCAERALFVGTQ